MLKMSSLCRRGDEGGRDGRAPYARKMSNLIRSIQCPLCLSSFDSPVSLECGHVFCMSCTEGLSGKRIQCPLCRSRTPRRKIRSLASMRGIVNAVEDMIDPRDVDCAGTNCIVERPLLTASTQSLETRELATFDLAVYFADKDAFECAAAKWKARHRDPPSLSLMVGEQKCLTFFLHLLQDGSECVDRETESVPLHAPSVRVFYVMPYECTVGDATLVVHLSQGPGPLGIVPCNERTSGWIAKYCEFMRDTGIAGVSFSVAVRGGSPRSCPSAEMSRVMSSHKGIPNDTCTLHVASPLEYRTSATRFYMRYVMAYISHFPSLSPIEKISLF